MIAGSLFFSSAAYSAPVSAQTNMGIADYALGMDKHLKSFPSEYQISGSVDSDFIKTVTTKNCVTKITTKSGTGIIDWKKTGKISPPNLFNVDDVSIPYGEEVIYIGASSAVTEDGDQPYDYEVAKFGAFALKYQELCKKG